VLPPEEELLSDKELRDASAEQIQNLIARIDLMLRGRGHPGIMVRQAPEEQPETPEPSDPADPNAGSHT
jgi:hypothetical protein